MSVCVWPCFPTSDNNAPFSWRINTTKATKRHAEAATKCHVKRSVAGFQDAQGQDRFAQKLEKCQLVPLLLIML